MYKKAQMLMLHLAFCV